MIKVIPPGSFDFGEEAVRLIKVASTGLRGDDYRSFTKRAGHELADWVKHAEIPSGERWVHALAMGAHEGTGQNSNADTWYAADLKKDHPTFEKYARLFRHHANKNPQKSYGLIKKSYFNPDMMRVELIIGLNGTKEAADRNGGLLADEEMAILDSGKDFPGSMSTKIAYDQCYPAGTLIETLEGLQPIESLEVGCEVKTHKGRYRKITATMQRPYTGDLVELAYQGSFTSITPTTEHPMLVVRGDNRVDEPKAEWMTADRVQVGDFLLYPVLTAGSPVDIETRDKQPRGLHPSFHVDDLRFIPGYLLIPVKAVTRHYVQDLPVFNISVEEDETYIAGSVVTHNCLIRGCGNKATHRSQYCDEATCPGGGMKKHAGRVLEDGQVVCVANFGNKFFDWSRVHRPADKTAYVFGKVASAQGVVSGAELAEQLGLVVPDYLLDDEYSTSRSTLHLVKLARDQAQRERALPASSYALAFTASTRPALEGLEKIAEEDRRLALKALAKAQVVLTPGEWLSLLTGEPLPKCADAHAQIAQVLPFEYRDIQSDSALGDLCKAAVFPALEPPVRLQRWADRCAEGRSLHPQDVQRRQWLAVMRGDTLPVVKSAASVTPAVQHLARHYIAYQLAFLHEVEKFANSPLTAELLIYQNRASG